jgi:hypothetical protein
VAFSEKLNFTLANKNLTRVKSSLFAIFDQNDPVFSFVGHVTDTFIWVMELKSDIS